MRARGNRRGSLPPSLTTPASPAKAPPASSGRANRDAPTSLRQSSWAVQAAGATADGNSAFRRETRRAPRWEARRPWTEPSALAATEPAVGGDVAASGTVPSTAARVDEPLTAQDSGAAAGEQADQRQRRTDLLVMHGVAPTRGHLRLSASACADHFCRQTIPLGFFPTGMVLMTSSVSRSMTLTVSSSWFVT